MDDQDSQRFIGDITVELTEISGSINKTFTAFTEKQFYDKGLANSIKEVIESSVKSILENKSFDENLGETIKAAIAEAAGKIADIKVDVSPVVKIGLQMVSQVKDMITAFTNMPKGETNDVRYESMLSLMLDTLKKNNEILGKIALQQQSPIGDVIDKREVESWEFVHIRSNDRIQSTRAIPKYKN